MMKKNWIPSLLMLPMGACLAWLRLRERAAAYDPLTGLYTPWHTLSLLHGGAVLLCLAICCWIAGRMKVTNEQKQEESVTLGTVPFLLGLAFAAVMGIGACLTYRALWYSTFDVPWLEQLYVLLLALGTLAMIVYCASCYGKTIKLAARLSLAVLALLFCVELLYWYRSNAANPALNDYLWLILALSAAAVGVVQYMGYFYNVASPVPARAALLFGCCGLLGTTADAQNRGQMLIRLALGLFCGLLAGMAVPLAPEQEEKKEKMKRQEKKRPAGKHSRQA